MDCINYRNSGELSDIIVVIDGEEFHLHKFPLFVRSNYFKNLSLNGNEDDDSSVSKVTLENFPGGSRIFAIIADYCYNKSVEINKDNVIAVRCASEYLEMTNGYGRSGLSMLTDNILFDLTYSAKAKKDYNASLTLLERAAEFSSLAEKAGIHTKLIESFVENLTAFVRKSSIYENKYEKTSVSKHNKDTSLHSISLSYDNVDALNHLPLRWINDLVRFAFRYGLNHSLLSYIIQNYIDYNTKINPNYNLEENVMPKATRNLVSMAADILSAENKLSSLLNVNEREADLASKKTAFNLINIAQDIRKNCDITQANNLTQIASEIRGTDLPKATHLTQIATEIRQQDEPEVSNLTQIASDIRNDDSKTSNLINITSK